MNPLTYISPDIDTGTAIALLTTYAVVGLLVYIASAFLLSKVFQKAGVARWKAWVPIANFWAVLELGGKPGWIALLSLIPVVNLVAVVFFVLAMIQVNQGFGQQKAMLAVGVLFFPVWCLIMAYGKAQWHAAGRHVAA